MRGRTPIHLSGSQIVWYNYMATPPPYSPRPTYSSIPLRMLPPPPYQENIYEELRPSPRGPPSPSSLTDLELRVDQLSARLHQLQLQGRPRHRPACSTRQSPPPTWGQIKSLTEKAKGLVYSQHLPMTSDRLFVAMLAMIATQSSSDN
ncbi:uncharacterized protein LOC110347126 [Heterocephalus glaber]|uniref:Uncharacterized protein LOC110347126 n=1 Tax=Heterocephalus glaber TaxID=10181 RepID=A0AAX6SAD8_HETGA|nr:uncharacterized protein LOC110347126 [Heterocephalus glaber]